ncbi:transposable element Tcb1 transposase [Trichonephila clavipes]|nr:transposable element Tcb1 transposase [Trichonephila clavipes]
MPLRKQRSAFDQVSEFDREKIVAYRDCGLTFREISSRVGRNETTVMQILSGRTIRRRLQQSGLSASRPLLGLPSTQYHIRLHRQWCDERRMWAAEWNKVVFTDESRICLQHYDGRIRVWRHREERMLNSCILHRHTGPAPDIMVWGGIGYHSRTPLVHFSDTFNIQRYICEVLEPVVLPYLQGLATAYFQQDNARTLVARIVQLFFVNHQIELLLWQALSLDLSLIENICQVIYSQFGLAIHQSHHQARRRFVEWAQNEIAVVPDFHKRILFSDEAHFWLNGYVNKQNCRIWSEANSQVYVETSLHPEKLTVWCALWVGGIIVPYFFKNDEGHNVTVNGDRYRAMITNFFIPELNNHDVQQLWFQQDGETCHTARAIIDLLKDTLGDRLISRFEPVNWPPRSCDLTLLDNFMWGYVKSLVYVDKPQTLDHLEDNIRRVIADIRPQMLEKVIENWTSRLNYIRASRDSYMPEIIFKM